MVEKETENNTVWGAPQVVNVNYIGAPPPVNDPKDDKYTWGVGEDADYITLSPIFNPVNTTWPGKNDVWGYDVPENTPRRATIGTQSRCSKKSLDTMHAENKKGNHVGSEMTPQTVSLLHGLKAVYAPIPIYFDRSWSGESLQRYFNPGSEGHSGSSEESPFSRGREGRFQGNTWHYRAIPPQTLYNNCFGLEDGGFGGPEVCLVNMSLWVLLTFSKVGESPWEDVFTAFVTSSHQGCGPISAGCFLDLKSPCLILTCRICIRYED